MRRAPATLTVLLMLLVAGCLGAGVPPAAEAPANDADGDDGETAPAASALSEPVTVVEDLEGDATEHNSDQAAAAARQVCNLVHTSQRASCLAAIPHDHVGGTPARGALDLVSLHVQESADEIVFRIGLADLTDDPAPFVDATGQYGALVRVDYRSGTTCTGGVSFWVDVVPDAVYVQAYHSRSHDTCEPEPGDPLQGRCATVNPCTVAVPWRIEPGTPGALVISVPRAQTALLAMGTVVEADALVLRMTGRGMPGGWMQPGSNLGTGQFSFDQRVHAYVVDDTRRGEFTLAMAGRADAWGEAASVTRFEAAAGRIVEGDLDLQSIALADDARNFTIEMTLRELPPAPDDLDFILQFTTPGKHLYVLYGRGDGGEWQVWGERVLPDKRVAIATEVAAKPGTPGTITITIPRTDLPGTSAGGLTRGFFGLLQRATQEDDPDGAAGNYYVSTFTKTGVGVRLPPYRFVADAAEAAAIPAIEITDAVGDTQVPPDTAADPAFRASRFDLAYATLRAVSDQRVRLDLGVVGLDAMSVPTLYDGAFYGAGLQTERGAWMVVLVQEKSTGTPTAICGPDVAFLTADPNPPTAAAGVPVAYTIIPASGDAAGLLSFDVPAACLGIGHAIAEFPVSRLAARSGVIGNPVGAVSSSPVTILDEALDTEGGRLVFPQAAVAPPSPWAEPFGIPNFWDILGVALAVLVAFVSVALFLARRVRMKRYLVRIEDLAETHHDDPKRYAEELVALRKRVFEDMLANRVTEGHFVMIEERLRGHLSSTRINAFGRAFYRLPPAFMIRLQSLLADGRFSTQDHRALTELLGEIEIPAEARAAVQAQIDLWAAQDRAISRMTRLARSRRGWRRLLPRRSAVRAEAAE